MDKAQRSFSIQGYGFCFYCLDSVLLQSKRSNTGVAVIKCCYHSFGCSVQPLNSQCNPEVSRKPEFKKTVSQSGNSVIEQNITILVNRFYIKLFSG